MFNQKRQRELFIRKYRLYIARMKLRRKLFLEKRKRAIEQINIDQINDNNMLISNSYMKINIPFDFKDTYASIIPLNVYTCWHTKDLPPLMKANYEKLIHDNPEFNVYLYDEDDCREFIKNHFPPDLLNTYNTLIPCSYKSDLWRFCMLYINGGIYLDIKYQCVNNFKFIALTEKEYFVKDLKKDVYTALIITLPKNEILLKCINQIVENVKIRFYGNTSLEPTGPALLGRYFTQDEVNNLELYHGESVITNILNEHYIVYNNSIILSNYRDYRGEQSQFQKNKYYTLLWEDKNIYV